MGLGQGVAPAVCEHAVLTRTVHLAWPEKAPRQVWGPRATPVEPHDLLEVKTRGEFEQITTVVFDLTQLVFSFPKIGREWIRTHCNMPYATFEGECLEDALTQCIDGGWPIGTVEQLSNGRYVVDVDTFTDEMLTAFLFDRLLDARYGLTSHLQNLRVAYYVMDGERPAAKSTTAKKRSASRCQSKESKIHRRVVDFLGPHRQGLLKPTRVEKDGVEMWQGSLFDYLGSRDNLWELLGRLRKATERAGGLTMHGIDVFVARGWHSRHHSSAGWFRIAGNCPETTRPLRDYFEKTIDMEADAMMIRLGRLVVDHLNGPCLLSTVDTDVLVSMISLGSPDLVWAKQLSFKNSKDVVVRTEPLPSGAMCKITPDHIDLRSLYPLDEPAISGTFLFPKFSKFSSTFFFSACRLSDQSKWSIEEATSRLSAVFILLMAGCDFCEKLENYGTRGVVQSLSQKPKLDNVCFTRITLTKHMTKETELGMRHECLVHLADAVRFPWRCGNFVCLVEVTFETMIKFIQIAICPKSGAGKDLKPFIRRLCYSAMTISGTGIGLEKDLKVYPQLAQNYGYDPKEEFGYMQFETS